LLKLDGADFTIGRAKFFDDPPGGGEPTAKVFIRIVLEGQDTPIFAQLDTGSPWSILAREHAEELGLLGNADGMEKNLSTREGMKAGRLVKVSLTIPADEDEGQSLDIPEATVFVSEDWPVGRSFIGYGGLIELIRIGLDPQENYFYFGPNGLGEQHPE